MIDFDRARLFVGPVPAERRDADLARLGRSATKLGMPLGDSDQAELRGTSEGEGSRSPYARGMQIMESLVPPERFWALVAEVDWPTRKTQPHAEGRRFLRERLSREEAVAFAEHFQRLRFAMRWAVDDAIEAHDERTGEEFEIGEDQLDDLICNIIGLGQQEYEAVIADPSLALQRAEAGDYPESFLYLVPRPADYDQPADQGPGEVTPGNR